MGYFGKLNEKEKAISLRKQGYSYSQIREKINVSKSTLSLWCRDIKLNKSQKQKILNKRNKSALKGSIKAAKIKREQKIEKSKFLQAQSSKKIGKLNKRDRFIAGISLYLGDGYKTEYRFGFSNANPKIIEFMFNWLVEFGEVDKDKIRGRIWLHDNLDESLAKEYWSGLLGIDKNNFIKSYVVNKSSKKKRKNIHRYGVFSLIVNSRDLQERMIGFMSGILLD
jgi:hypothetical protein